MALVYIGTAFCTIFFFFYAKGGEEGRAVRYCQKGHLNQATACLPAVLLHVHAYSRMLLLLFI